MTSAPLATTLARLLASSRRGQAAEAAAAVSSLLENARTAADPLAEARCLATRAMLASEAGDPAGALESARLAALQAHGGSDLALRATCGAALAVALLQAGELGEAVGIGFASEVQAREAGDLAALHAAQLAIVRILQQARDPAEAVAAAREALATARELQDPAAVAASLAALADTVTDLALQAARQGADAARARADEAVAEGRNALLVTTSAHVPAWQTEAELALARALVLVGEADAARTLAEAACARARQLGTPPLIQRARLAMAEIALAAGDAAGAVTALDPDGMTAAAPPIGLALDLACQAQRLLAVAHCERGETAAALAAADAALSLDQQRDLRLQDLTRRVREATQERERFELELQFRRNEVVELAPGSLELARRAEALIEAGQRDRLTELASRARFDQLLPQLIETARLAYQPFALVLIDICQLRGINDRFGRAIGDQVLRRMADVVRAHLRGSDLAARYDGDELILLLSRVGGSAQARQVCERLVAAVAREPWQAIAANLRVSVSIGIALLQSTDTPERILERSERAMGRARQRGENGIELAPALDL